MSDSNLWRPDRVALSMLLAPRHAGAPSVRRMMRDCGLNERFSCTKQWPDAVVQAVAEHLGVKPEAFAVGRPRRKGGRPRGFSARKCPVEIALPDDLRAAITVRASAQDAPAGELIMAALRKAFLP